MLASLKDQPLHDHEKNWASAIELQGFLKPHTDFHAVCNVVDDELKKSLQMSMDSFERECLDVLSYLSQSPTNLLFL